MSWEAVATTGLLGGVSLWVALEYFWLSWEAVTIMSIVLAIDFIMGILEVWLKRRDELSSTKAWQGLFKKMTRWLLPFIVVIVLKGAGLEDVSYLSSVVCGIIILSEGYSIIAHIYAINQPWDEHLPEVNALQYIIEFISKIFKTAIEDKTSIKKNLEEEKEDGEK